MDNVDADFIIQNDNPIQAEFELNESEHFDCSFELFAAGTVWGSISGDISNQTDLINALNDKQDVLTAGDNIQIEDNVISATDTTYTAGQGIDITNGVISNTQTSAEWGNIQGDISDQTDLINALNEKQDTISDLGTIRENAAEGASAYSTIQTYGDIVTYDAADFATSAQGTLANTALQPGDNVSELVNNAGYITSADLPTVNDGKLALKVNSVDVGEFTANQSTDTTVNISVPTATSDLVNDSGFVTNNATGTNAFAVGNTSQSTAEGGVAVGYGARANSTYSTAVGEDTRATNTNTTVIGRGAKATQARAIAIGSGAEANAQDAIAIKGINNTANTFQVYTYNMLDMSTGLIPDARISSNIARSADMTAADNDLQDQIDNLKARGRFLALWNCSTGLAETNPPESPYVYQAGDYFIIGVVSSATPPVNYKPNGSSYTTGVASTTVESAAVDVDDVYYYDGTNWKLQVNTQKTTSFVNIAGSPYDNTNLATALNAKADISSLATVATTGDYEDLTNTPTIPTVNDGTLTIEVNGTSAGTFTANQSSNTTASITVPTDTSDLTNGAGYITASSIPTDYYTKSEIDSLIPQPTKEPIVYYQPTNSYCYDESNNRFYGSHVSEKLYLVKPKTTGTEQVIDMSTTFSLSFTVDYEKAPSTAITVAEIMVSYAAGKGVLLQLNSTGLYYRNNITGTTISGTRTLIAGNSYDIKVEYDGTHMIISYKLSSDVNYTQANSTTCTASGSNYNYAAVGMDIDYGNLPLSSVILTNGVDTLYSYTAGKIALDYDSSLTLNASNQLKVVTDQTYDDTSTNPQSGAAIAGAGFITSAALSDYVDLTSAQNITGTKTFVGQKKIAFKQSGSSDKLGFTLYNNSGTEKGYLEFNPSNLVDNAPLMTLGNYTSTAAGVTHVGFRKYDSNSGGAYNLLSPLVSDAKTPFSLSTTYTNFYLPLGFTDGVTTVKTPKTGLVDISTLLPTVNDATITINQGGVQKGTFTLNQSGNTTIDLDAGGGTDFDVVEPLEFNTVTIGGTHNITVGSRIVNDYQQALTFDSSSSGVVAISNANISNSPSTLAEFFTGNCSYFDIPTDAGARIANGENFVDRIWLNCGAVDSYYYPMFIWGNMDADGEFTPVVFQRGYYTGGMFGGFVDSVSNVDTNTINLNCTTYSDTSNSASGGSGVGYRAILQYVSSSQTLVSEIDRQNNSTYYWNGCQSQDATILANAKKINMVRVFAWMNGGYPPVSATYSINGTDTDWNINDEAESTTVLNLKYDNSTITLNSNGELQALNPRNIGEIIQSTIPLTDAGLYLLDGSLINGSGIYSAFVTYISGFVTDYPDLFCTEANWQSAVTTYGVCGKFVYDSVNNTVRLPKITGILEGTTDVTALGDLVQAGLPNITADASMGAGTDYGLINSDATAPTGAFKRGTSSAAGRYNAGGTGGASSWALGFDASLSSTIYGNSNTVQPQTIKAFYYIVIATSTKTDIQVDIDEIATDLNGKADTDLTNATDTANILMAHNAMPSSTYVDLTVGANGSLYTAPADGWFCCDIAAFNSSCEMYCGKLHTTSWVGGGNYAGIIMPVRKGGEVQLYYSQTPRTFAFVYANGSESEAS